MPAFSLYVSKPERHYNAFIPKPTQMYLLERAADCIQPSTLSKEISVIQPVFLTFARPLLPSELSSNSSNTIAPQNDNINSGKNTPNSRLPFVRLDLGRPIILPIV